MKNYITQILKIIVIDILITIFAILFLSFLVYKLRFGDNTLRAGIVVVYAVSNFLGGFIIGKIKENKKFIWGALIGLIYFVILTIVSVIATGELFGNGNMAVMAFVASVIGGMAGGMLS